MNTYRSEAEVSENACSEHGVRVAEVRSSGGRPCEAGAPTEPAGETASSTETTSHRHRKFESSLIFKLRQIPTKCTCFKLVKKIDVK